MPFYFKNPKIVNREGKVDQFLSDIEHHYKNGDEIILYDNRCRIKLANGNRFHVSNNEYWSSDELPNYLCEIKVPQLNDDLFKL